MAEPDFEGFARAVMGGWPDAMSLDDVEVWDLAVKYRLLREIPGGFDPEKHDDSYGLGLEVGDPFYELNYNKDKAGSYRKDRLTFRPHKRNGYQHVLIPVFMGEDLEVTDMIIRETSAYDGGVTVVMEFDLHGGIELEEPKPDETT